MRAPPIQMIPENFATSQMLHLEYWNLPIPLFHCHKLTWHGHDNCTFDSPQIGNPQIGRALEVTAFCGDGRAATPKPIACCTDIGQTLKATGLPGSGGCPI
jgi:hypothetical protein